MYIDGEEAGKERKAAVRTIDDGQRICAFYAREQREDGGGSLMGMNGFCNYVYMDKFVRIDKERAKKEETETRVARKWPNEVSGEGTGEKTQRNG